jgi:dihydrofolate reductase
MPAQISIIVAHDDKRGIGKNNQLLFRISEDLKRFKKITLGHPIIMGRKTHQSIGRPLPARTNIIITRNQDFQSPGCLVTHSLAEAIKLAKQKDNQEIFIIGGGQIYQQALDQDLVDKLYITQVKGDYQAEIFFPDYSKFKKIISKKDSQEDKYSYTFLELKR